MPFRPRPFSRRLQQFKPASMLAAAAGILTGAVSVGENASGSANPYARIDWDSIEFLHSFSHQHGRNPQLLWDMGFRHLPFSNYYPSRPFYPLPDSFWAKHPEALGAPNAEQHSTTDVGIHFNALGSFYTTGYGHSPRWDGATAPFEYVFTGLNVFNARQSPWLGVYRLDLSMVPGPKPNDGKPALTLTIQGAREVNRTTFEPVGEGLVQERRFTESPGTIHLKTESDSITVRLDFDTAATRISRLRLMQGVNRSWRDAFAAALDGDLKDSGGRPLEGLQYADGGGITVNHPTVSSERLIEMLDYDPRVLGIEVWNNYYYNRFGHGFGARNERDFYRTWDEILRTGRRCFGFFVKDHSWNGRGRNVLLVPESAQRDIRQREQNALRAYREGHFFGLLGAMTLDESGAIVNPYDYSRFRFTRIALREDAERHPVDLEVRVTGADPDRRPNVHIRFITDSGIAHCATGEQTVFTLPRIADGTIACRYVRVEAFAYPDTHANGRALTAAALSAMDVHEISRLHDRLDKNPIPIVDMIFSQPIMFE